MEELCAGENIDEEAIGIYIEQEKIVDIDSKGPPIAQREFTQAISDLNDKKATSINGISGEILKNIYEKASGILFKIISDSYEDGILPDDFVTSKTITLPKKGNAIVCSNYRTIALLSHASKVVLNFVKNRLKRRIEEKLDKDQFGFRARIDTREAILALKQILECRIEMETNICGFRGSPKSF